MKKYIIFILLVCRVAATVAETDMSMTIQEAKDKHQAALMALPGVVTMGIGLSEGEKVIMIGLDGKHPDTKEKLPKALEGYKVIIQDVGTIKAR